MVGKKRNYRKSSSNIFNQENDKENLENSYQEVKDEGYLKDNSLEILLNEALKDRTSVHLNKKLNENNKLSKGKTFFDYEQSQSALERPSESNKRSEK